MRSKDEKEPRPRSKPPEPVDGAGLFKTQLKALVSDLVQLEEMAESTIDRLLMNRARIDLETAVKRQSHKGGRLGGKKIRKHASAI